MKPVLDPEGWRLKFQVKDFRLYRKAADELSVARAAWDMAKGYVHPHLEKIFINLAPPLAQVRELVPATAWQESCWRQRKNTTGSKRANGIKSAYV